jgi:hypothetical protein
LIRKGHTCPIVVSDPQRLGPIWFGGTDRSQARMDLFFARARSEEVQTGLPTHFEHLADG